MNSGRSCASQPTTASSTTVTAIAGPRKPLPKTTTVVPTRTAVAISQPIPVDSTRCGSGGASPVGRRRIGWRGGSGVRRSASTTADDRAGSMSALIPIKNADPLLRTPSLVGRQPEWQKLRPSWHVSMRRLVARLGWLPVCESSSGSAISPAGQTLQPEAATAEPVQRWRQEPPFLVAFGATAAG